ncbi:MAG: calcium/sodium antiporter [Opitutae bacterium]|nr:calcium/sodium antiporter [Opitutae bacterium]
MFPLFIGALILSMVLGFFLLTKGGDLLSDHCSNLAESIGVPSVVVGLTIVSIATSAPELFTSIAAVSSGAQGLILGNIIGSNIANIGLILGISLFISPINTVGAVSSTQRNLLLILSFSFTGFLLFSSSQALGFWPGVILLIFISSYLILITRNALLNKNSKLVSNKSSNKDTKLNNIPLSVLMILIATSALWVGSDSLVFGAKNLASLAGVPEELIGFTLVAIGTSLPELAASISLTKKKEYTMLMGNILGSNLFNIALVGGIAGIMGPIQVSTTYPWIDYLSLLILTGLFTFWLKGKILTKSNGLMLLTLYLCATIATWMYNS